MGVEYKRINKDMVMFVTHEDGTNFIDFNIERQDFKIGEVIEIDQINGKLKVVSFDRVTVTVQLLTK